MRFGDSNKLLKQKIAFWEVNKGIAVVMLIVALFIVAVNNRMVVCRYEVEAAELSVPIRIALVTDLHSCYYGKNQAKLLETIDAQAPDIVLLGGDIFDDVNEDRNAEIFLAGISGIYPCYYVTGNHEYWSGQDNFTTKMDILNRYQITILSGISEVIELNGETINLCGINDPDAYMVETALENDPQAYINAQSKKEDTFIEQLNNVSSILENENFTLLLSHRPEFFELYAEYGFDLVLSGHAHGGQWRIPFVLNGVYAPNQGLFPKYAGGRYEEDGTIMIVSRGLARESTPVPRIFNRPEMVIVDIT